MTVLMLGKGAYKRSGLPEVVLRNLYLEQDQSGLSPDQTLRAQRPGLVLDHKFVDTIRALHYRTSSSERLTVAGNFLFSGTTNVGSLIGGGIAPMVSTAFLTLIASDGVLYSYNGSVSTIALPNDAPSSGLVQDVDQLNGYGLVLLPNGRYYWIVPGETAIQPLNYATAESLPDGAVALRRLGDEFWIFGTENIEVWQPTGDLDAPFQRASGRNFERGCLYRDAVRRFDNTLVWIGDDYQVYRASNVPTVISDNGISERVSRATDDCSAWTFGLDGHAFYVLRIPGEGTFAYDASTKSWSNFDTFGEAYWRPYVGYQEGGIIYCGSSADGAVYRVSTDAYDDAGTAIERVVTATVSVRGKPPRDDSFSVGVTSTQDCTVRLRWKDGQDDFPDYYDPISVRAPIDVADIWRLGQPDQPYRTFELSCIDPARITINGAVANEAWP